jgi:hypothetical protein
MKTKPTIPIFAALTTILVIGLVAAAFVSSTSHGNESQPARAAWHTKYVQSAKWMTLPGSGGGILGVWHNARDISITENNPVVVPGGVSSNTLVTFRTEKGELVQTTGSKPFITNWQPHIVSTDPLLITRG